MTFIHPLLLAGLVLAGVPILLHLIMRQKPKHLLFPAVRFLLQRQRTNQRKLQLRHLLLLALRMLIIIFLCLALARPRIFSERFQFTADRRVAAVLIFDTSYSMEYTSGGRTRLDEAKRRSQELLDELGEGSRVAVLDTAEPGGEWLQTVSLARERIAALELRPGNYPITTLLGPAYDLFTKLEQESEDPEEAPMRFLYVFSDRMHACWNANQLENLKRIRDRLPPPGVVSVFVDLGVENPADLAITSVELPRQIVAANDRLVIKATVQATGTDCDNVVLCRIDGDAGERKPVKLAAGQSEAITFERRDLAQGLHQAEISLATTDALPFNNIAFATFEVRGARKVLILTDEEQDAFPLALALETRNGFACTVKTMASAFLVNLSPQELQSYQAVCLLNVAQPNKALWDILIQYVRNGGGLAIMPGGEELRREAYNGEDAQQLMPAKLSKVVAAPDPGALWNLANFQHPIMIAFGEWSKKENIDFFQPGLQPAAYRYWELDTVGAQYEPIVKYNADNDDKKVALLERLFDRKKVRGKVLLFTTPVDDRHLRPDRPGAKPWNNYLKNSFYLVLAVKTVGYLAGDAEDGSFNHFSGQNVIIPLPQLPRFLTYTVQGPGLGSTDSLVPREASQSELEISKAVMPGNYTVIGADGKRTSCFSLNIPPDESQLTPVPAEQIEALFGLGALLPLDSKRSLHEALQSHWNQPVELLPWLMMLLLLVLAVENLLANKFYRREASPDDPGA
jgi:hypothetical protein